MKVHQSTYLEFQKLNLLTVIVDQSKAKDTETIRLKICDKNEDKEIGRESFRISKSGNTFIVNAIDEPGAM